MKAEQKEGSTSYFKVLEYKGREVTISLVITDKDEVVVGYAICSPQDEFDEVIASTISTGRALKKSTRLMDFDVDSEHQNDEVMKFILDKVVDEIESGVEYYIPDLRNLPEPSAQDLETEVEYTEGLDMKDFKSLIKYLEALVNKY